MIASGGDFVTGLRPQSAIGHYGGRNLGRDPSAETAHAVDTEPPPHCLDAISQALKPEVVSLDRAAHAVVLNLQFEVPRVEVDAHTDRRGVRMPAARW